MIVVAVVLVGGAILILLSGSDSPETAALRFMTALAKGDVDTLTKLTYAGNESPDDIRKQWDFAENVAGKHYAFLYNITASSRSDENDAAITMDFTKNYGKPGSYNEPVQIPMVRDNGVWKVDVPAVDRTMFPALPH
jgi:hypothetical protein